MEEHIIAQKTSGDKNNKRSASDSQVQTSAIVTLYNFENNLVEFYSSLLQALKKGDPRFEVIFVDGGSKDNSWVKLKELSAKERRVKLVRLRSRFDESVSFDAGLKRASGKKIVFFNTRVHINPAQISRLLEKMDEGFDLIMGWRYPRRDSKLNQIISRAFNWIVRKFSDIALHDVNSGVLATRREVLEDIPIYGDLNIFIPITAAQKGYRVTDVKVEQLPGTFRQSKYISEYFQRLLDIITVIFLTKYSKKPLHFLGFFGLIFAIAGAAMNIYLLIYRFFQFGPIAGRPLLLLGALLLVIGVQMISIGLIGEMIIFTHAKDIKEYSIEEILE